MRSLASAARADASAAGAKHGIANYNEEDLRDVEMSTAGQSAGQASALFIVHGLIGAWNGPPVIGSSNWADDRQGTTQTVRRKGRTVQGHVTYWESENIPAKRCGDLPQCCSGGILRHFG